MASNTRILIYGDSNLNIIDGSSVWIVNLAKLIASNKKYQVDILLKLPIKNNVLSSDLDSFSNVNLIPHTDFTEKTKMVKDTNVTKIISRIDEKNSYSSIIVRGTSVVSKLIRTDLKSKIIPYITDFCQNKNKITPEEKEELALIYNSVNDMFVQTVEMKEYFKDILDIDGEKFTLLSPIVFPLPAVKKEEKTICYAGKIAKDWYIEELIEIMAKLYEKDPEIKLYFIGNKFNYDMLDFKEEITSKLEAAPNIEYIPQLPNEKTREIINKCELGYAFRSENIDNDDSLELSTKFLEYGFCQMPSIIRKTKMFSDILGDDYPLYVDDIDDAADKILKYFESPDNRIKNIKDKFEGFTCQKVYANIDKTLSKESKFSLKRIKGLFR